jgi:hypothetical protein
MLIHRGLWTLQRNRTYRGELKREGLYLCRQTGAVICPICGDGLKEGDSMSVLRWREDLREILAGAHRRGRLPSAWAHEDCWESDYDALFAESRENFRAHINKQVKAMRLAVDILEGHVEPRVARAALMEAICQAGDDPYAAHRAELEAQGIEVASLPETAKEDTARILMDEGTLADLICPDAGSSRESHFFDL